MAGESALFISVIIPTKDRPDLLQRALRSALAQVGPAFEVIVVDDGEGAGLATVAALGQPGVRAVCSNRRGQVPARNLGVAAARGTHVAFLDDDDWWDGTAHLAALATSLPPEPALAYGSGTVVIEDAGQFALDELPFEAIATAETLAANNTLIVSSLLYDRRLHEQLGAFDESFPYYWDWDWYLRVARSGAALVKSASTAARISARHGSVSSQANMAARRADLDRLSAKHGLGHIPLRNHESIARDRRDGSA
jgi:glycosyltransferase involved in cell wall biosynthesis